MDELAKTDWRTLVLTIESGRCILVLGPNAALSHEYGQPVALNQLLARRLTESPGAAEPVADENNLAHVAQRYYCKTRNRVWLEKEVSDFFAQYNGEATPTHRDLAALPFSLCLTTTHDSLFQQALIAAGKTPQVEHYNFRKNREWLLTDGAPQRPIVYKMYGSTDDPESLVITEADLLDFLVNIIQKAPPVAPYIASRFADKDLSFLFIGFGFQQWHLRILLHLLQAHDHKQRSLALEGDAFFTHPDHDVTALYFENEMFLDFENLSVDQFAARLRQEFEAQAGPAQPAPALPSDAPVAFLCHCSSDREAVATLESALHRFGVNTWRDAQNLRGGDDWDRQIEHVLSKQVHYVLVLQTREMESRHRSYFYKEIKAAREQGKEFAEGYRFTIPCLLEPCDGLPQLSDLHREDITTPQGVQRLAETILSDWRRRHSTSAEPWNRRAG